MKPRAKNDSWWYPATKRASRRRSQTDPEGGKPLRRREAPRASSMRSLKPTALKLLAYYATKDYAESSDLKNH